MTTFYLVCAGLVLLSGVFYLFPRVPPGGGDEELTRANRDWFRLRQRELSTEGADALEEEARLRLLEDGGEAGDDPPRSIGRHFPTWALLPVVAVLAGVLDYTLGGARDVQLVRQLETIGPDTSPAAMRQLVGAIEARVAQRPDNLHYLALLGRYYMAQSDYASALSVYERLLERVPGDAQALAYAAQAQYLAANRQLADSARLRAEQALSIDPHQRTALGLLGMASYEQGRYRAAIDYWERLLATEAPGSEGARMIADVLERARREIGDEAPAPRPEEGVTVRVSLPAGAEIQPDATLYVLARGAAAASRMPIAVSRLSAAELPLTLRLDDSNSMAGRKISEQDAVVVVAQVSPDGRPGEANATWVGRGGPVAPAIDGEPVEIRLAPNPERAVPAPGGRAAN
ncbi:MAG: tetratricopeptide repeat protein [Halioglobus sp.]|nr:tetratricopeptide repeat protein [Halioglobus sp.]